MASLPSALYCFLVLQKGKVDTPIMTHSELVQRAYKWILTTQSYNHFENYKCSFAFREFNSLAIETPDVIGWKNASSISVLIECKVSRSDFLSDKKKKFRINKRMATGNYRFYACPSGLIKQEELPKKWGLIYFHSKKATVIKHPTMFTEVEIAGNELTMLCSALRRLHLRGMLESIYEPFFNAQQG